MTGILLSMCLHSFVGYHDSINAIQGETKSIEWNVRKRTPVKPDAKQNHTMQEIWKWDTNKTAIIICDVWDSHHSERAVNRVNELVPRLNEVVKKARELGMTVIHAPSDCMPYYKDHPARKRAESAPKAESYPKDITSWCSKIPSEEQATYPIDQSDGGEDDDPEEHKVWLKKLEGMGRNPGMPWLAQHKAIEIDRDNDYISDRGDEVWNIIQDRGIENVILAGVHTNMCVLGRPFGLRQMVQAGMNTLLIRDMTDTMYNPASWPFVSHFSGTDLIIEHIERYVCPTITSDQFIGGKPFRFAKDDRPQISIVIAEDEYDTVHTLPAFAEKHLRKDFRLDYVFASANDRNNLPGIESLENTDLCIFSVRRRVLPKSQMEIIRQYVEAGKPVIGIRTTSHAFELRNQEPPEGLVDWKTWNRDVFGGDYQDHYGNKLKVTVMFEPKQIEHPMMRGIIPQTIGSLEQELFTSGGSLYRMSAAPTAKVLMLGMIQTGESHPVAWCFDRNNGGKSFYTSLGHKQDFQNVHFQRLLYNAVHWGLNKDVPPNDAIIRSFGISKNHNPLNDFWRVTKLPLSKQLASQVKADQALWLRCMVRIPATIDGREHLLAIHNETDTELWVNGQKLQRSEIDSNSEDSIFKIPTDCIEAGDLNLIVVKPRSPALLCPTESTPIILIGNRKIELSGKWQYRISNHESFSSIPLPAKFAASTDVVHD